MPSITFCIPTVFQRPKLENHYPDLKQKVKQLKLNYTMADADRDTKYVTTLRNWFNEYQNKALSKEKADVIFNLGFEPNEIINCLVLAPQSLGNDTRLKDGWIDCSLAYGHPLKSWTGKGMCYTYFSKLNSSIGDDNRFRLDINQGLRDQAGLIMQMQINLKTDQYMDKTRFGDEFVMIHSNMLLPSDAKKASIKPGRQ
jgi:hypothetical protein